MKDLIWIHLYNKPFCGSSDHCIQYTNKKLLFWKSSILENGLFGVTWPYVAVFIECSDKRRKNSTIEYFPLINESSRDDNTVHINWKIMKKVEILRKPFFKAFICCTTAIHLLSYIEIKVGTKHGYLYNQWAILSLRHGTWCWKFNAVFWTISYGIYRMGIPAPTGKEPLKVI